MPLLDDLTTARELLGRIILSRRNRRAAAARRSKNPRPAPGAISVAVYFADAAVNLYQIRQWYAPLAELSTIWPVAIIARNSSAALALWDESPVPAVYLHSVDDLEDFIGDQDLRVVLYVNQNQSNFQMFRYGRMWHVFINHGESDKMYMTTNQVKAYDYSLVAGDAAIDRLKHKLWDFDIAKRVISIGRPQADHFAGELPFTADGRTVVLYAPTWEGDRAAAAYGSIASHGVALVEAVLASARHRLIYRPHPRSGVLDRSYKRANEKIISAITRANLANPLLGHIVDDGPILGWQLAVADVAVCDVSAMVYDRLAMGKPLIVTRPVAVEADIDESGYLGHCEWLEASSAPDIVAIAERVQFDESAQERLSYWVTRHFGDISPGAATTRFHAAIEHLMAEWDVSALEHAADGMHNNDNSLGPEA
jgi:hypothetical protein